MSEASELWSFRSVHAMQVRADVATWIKLVATESDQHRRTSASTQLRSKRNIDWQVVGYKTISASQTYHLRIAALSPQEPAKLSLPGPGGVLTHSIAPHARCLYTCIRPLPVPAANTGRHGCTVTRGGMAVISSWLSCVNSSPLSSNTSTCGSAGAGLAYLYEKQPPHSRQAAHVGMKRAGHNWLKQSWE